MFGFGWIAWLVASAEALLVRPAGRARQVTLGQEQPCPFRRHGVEQAVYRGTRGEPPGLPDRIQGSDLVAAGLPDPGQGDQAGRERGGVGELTAQGDARGDVPERGVELIALVGVLAQVDIGGADGRGGRPSVEVEALVEVLLDEPGGQGHLPGGYSVADGVVGQLMFGVPGRRVAVQLYGAARLLFQPG